MKKSTACMLAGIAAATMGITACASGSTTYHHHHGSHRSSPCSHVVYGQERLPLRPRASQRRVLP